MGRKNKIKLLKHGSPSSFVTSSMGDSGYFGSVIANERQSLDPEVMRANLRELVNGNEENQSEKLQFVYSEFKKKSAELEVAKKIIKQFQNEFHSTQTSLEKGDANSSLCQELLEKTRENEESFNRLKSLCDALEPIGDKAHSINGHYEVLKRELEVALQEIKNLEGKLACTESTLGETESLLEETKLESAAFEKHSKSLIRDLEISLQAANENIFALSEKTQRQELKNAKLSLQLEEDQKYRQTLETDLSDHKFRLKAFEENIKKAEKHLSELQAENYELKEDTASYRSKYEKACADLQIEKSIRAEQEKDLKTVLIEKEDAIRKLEKASSESEEAEAKVVKLQAEIELLKVSCNDVEKHLHKSEETRELLQQELTQFEKGIREAKVIGEEVAKCRLESKSYKIAFADFESKLQGKEDARCQLEKALDTCNKKCAGLAEKFEKATTEANMTAKENVHLKARIESLNIDCIDVANTYELEKKRRMELDEALKICILQKNEAIEKFKSASNKVEEFRRQVEELDAKKDVSTQLHMVLERERQLREKYEARYQSINGGVHQIKTDISLLKLELTNTKKKNEELQLQLTSYKADAKYYRDDGENCRKYIKKLEEQITNFSYEEVSDKESQYELDSIKAVFQKDSESNEFFSVLDAVKSLKHNYESKTQESISLLNDLTSTETVIVDLRNQAEQLTKNFEDLQKEYKLRIQEGDEEKKKLTSQLKKSRKENEKIKRKNAGLQSENENLIIKTKGFEDILSEVSNSSGSNESLHSEKSQSASELETTSLETSNQKAMLQNEERSDVKSNSLELSKKANQEPQILKELQEKNNTVVKLEVRINELQRSTSSLQQRYDNDFLAMRQKLEAAESSLCAQQEMNAKMEARCDDLKQKHSSESDHLKEENERLSESLKKHSQKIEEMIDDRIVLVDKMQLEIELSEFEKRQALDELVSCKLEITNSAEKIKVLEKELARIQELERTKTTVLVNLTEEEKEKIRIENDSFKMQLENSNKAMQEQREESKKLLDIEIRKQKKLLKISEKSRQEAEAKTQEAVSEYQKLQTEMSELKALVEEVHSDDQSKLAELKRDLEVANTANQDLKEQLDILSKAIVQQEEENNKIEEFNEERIILKTRQEELVAEIEALSAKLEKAEASIKEEDLAKTKLTSTTAALELLTQKNEELNKLIIEREESQKTCSEQWQSRYNEKQAEVDELLKRLSSLENQCSDLMAEHAEERSGLVTELCTAIERNKGFEKLGKPANEQVRELEMKLKMVVEENERNLALYEQIAGRQVDRIDTMFPSLDPAIRQLLRLLCENRNFSYGVLGLLAYAVLIHFYILL